MRPLARFDDRKAMAEASERFLAALTGNPLPAEVANDEWLSCGHAYSHVTIRNGERVCRLCTSRIERHRRLPGMIESTRQKLERLEAEQRKQGNIL